MIPQYDCYSYFYDVNKYKNTFELTKKELYGLSVFSIFKCAFIIFVQIKLNLAIHTDNCNYSYFSHMAMPIFSFALYLFIIYLL
jgi:hypothetical protein